MVRPDWLGWTLTVAFLGVACYGVARLVVAARPCPGYLGRHRAVDSAHALMAVGMAVMSSPVGGPLPHAGWQALAVLLCAWAVGAWVRAWRDRARPVGWHGSGPHHVVAGAAMLYMLVAVPHGSMSAPWMTGSSGVAAVPALGWVFVVYFAGRVALLGPRLWRGAGGGGLLVERRWPAVCEAVMAAGTAVMLAAVL